jgi:hypothetical protein
VIVKIVQSRQEKDLAEVIIFEEVNIEEEGINMDFNFNIEDNISFLVAI